MDCMHFYLVSPHKIFYYSNNHATQIGVIGAMQSNKRTENQPHCGTTFPTNLLAPSFPLVFRELPSEILASYNHIITSAAASLGAKRNPHGNSA